MHLSHNRDAEMATASFRIDDELKCRVDRLSETKGINPSELFRSALERAVEEAESDSDLSHGLKLSLLDRVILCNQSMILERLDDGTNAERYQNADGYKADQEALRCGYESQYHQLIACFDERGMSVALSREVLDILEMHRHMRNAFCELGADGGISEAEIRFGGFDGNNEAYQHAFTCYFLETLGRYEELSRQRHEYNSHCRMLPTYRRMLEVWKQRAEVYVLTESELRRVLDARTG